MMKIRRDTYFPLSSFVFMYLSEFYFHLLYFIRLLVQKRTDNAITSYTSVSYIGSIALGENMIHNNSNNANVLINEEQLRNVLSSRFHFKENSLAQCHASTCMKKAMNCSCLVYHKTSREHEGLI